MDAVDPGAPPPAPADEAGEPGQPQRGLWPRVLASLLAIGLGVAALVVAILLVRGVLA
jgi:hypothetical protein